MEIIKNLFNKSNIILINSKLNISDINSIFGINDNDCINIDNKEDILSYIIHYSRDALLNKLLYEDNKEIRIFIIDITKIFLDINNDTLLKPLLMKCNYKLIIINHYDYINITLNMISCMILNIDETDIKITKIIHNVY